MLYILHGKDEAQMRWKADQIKQKHGLQSWNWVDANTVSMAAGLAALDSCSLFDEEEMIVVENATFFSGKNTTDWDAAKIVQRNPNDKVIVFLVPSEKLDTRKKAVKEIEKKATVISCMPLDDKSLPSFVNEMLKEKQLSMDPEALDYFCQNAGFDCMILQNEIDKLKTYHDHLKLEDVKALLVVEPEQDVFKMTEALFAKDVLKFLEYYRSFRAQNMEPLAISGLLAGQIRFMFQVKVLLTLRYSQEEVANRLGVKKGRIYFSASKASRFSQEELLKHLAALADLDVKLKGDALDKDLAFEEYIISTLTYKK